MALELDEWLQESFSCTRSSCSPMFKDFQFSDKVFNVIVTLFRPPCNSISLKFFKNQLHLFKNPFKYIVKSNCFADKKELFKIRLSRVVIYFFEVMIVTRPFKKKSFVLTSLGQIAVDDPPFYLSGEPSNRCVLKAYKKKLNRNKRKWNLVTLCGQNIVSWELLFRTCKEWHLQRW